MLHIDISARLNAKNDASLDQLRADLNSLCAKYGKFTRLAVEAYYDDEEEYRRLTETPDLMAMTAEEFVGLNAKLRGDETASAEEPAPDEEPKPADDIDLPEFPAKDEVSKDDLRSLLRAVKEHSTPEVGLRDVYANAGKEGKTFSALSADEYSEMYQEGRKVLWQLMRS